MSKLTTEERELLKSYEAGEWHPVPDSAKVKQLHREYAAATFQKDARINIRISSRDLRLLQKRALSEGLPYQTMISALLHKYVEGRLVEQP